MVRHDLVAQKLSELADRTERVRAHRKADAASLAADRDALDLVCFNLMLAVQACTDIAGHIIADEGWTTPTSVADSFLRLAAHGVLDVETAHAMGRAVRFRNVVAHGYAAVDVAAAQLGSTEGLTDLDAFAREIAAWIVSRPTA